MKMACLIAFYTSFDTALRVMEDLAAEGFGADAVNVLGPHTAGRKGTATKSDIPPDRPGRHDVNLTDIGPTVVIGPMAEQLRNRDVIQVLRDRGVPAGISQRAAEGLRRGGALVVVDVPQSDHDRALAVIDRHNPGGLESLGEAVLEPGWSRTDRVAGDQGVVEVADDLLNVKKPGEDAAAFRPLAPGREELGLAQSGAEGPEPGSGELHGGQGAGPDR
jgi:hypothetical protein